jgi:hypothetical protein
LRGGGGFGVVADLEKTFSWHNSRSTKFTLETVNPLMVRSG